ncbi:MAG: DUF2309 domain-containing protein [Planctomycetaceae bacterium]
MHPDDDHLAQMIAAAARFLPPQGPIDAFVAQNTLQGFEDLPFEEALIRAGRLHGAQPFLPETFYRGAFDRGRIQVEDLDAVLTADLGTRHGQPLAGGRIRLGDLQRTLLIHGVRHESDAAVRWTLTENEVLDGDAGGELWHACVEASSRSRPSVVHVRPPLRHRDLILALEPTLDTDALVHPLLIRMTAAYLDQGVASWPMPDRQRGLLAAVAGLYSGRIGPLPPWCAELPDRLRGIRRLGAGGHDAYDAHDVIRAELTSLGVPVADWPEFIPLTLVALRGWAGMIRQFAERPDRAPVAAVPARLADFLALRLMLDRLAVEHVCRRMNGRGPRARDTADAPLAAFWTELRDRHPSRRGAGSLARAFLLLQVAQLTGLTAADIHALDDNELLELELAIAAFDSIARRRIFHLAYERRHGIGVLDGLAAQASFRARNAGGRPRVQAVFCIDDRCESFRRHLEEFAPDIDTFGTAGFFAVPMYYRGLDDWHAIPLCPIVVRPQHTVTEAPAPESLTSHRLRQAVRRSLGRVRGGMATGSRTLFRGGLLTSIGGAVAAVPLVARVAFPRITSLVTGGAAAYARSRVRTSLDLRRQADAPLPNGTQRGFDTDEMAAIVRRLLEDIGLATGFARLVAVIGHGSTSLNNPHESAYDCGACGGGRGGPNARAFALMANDPDVRARLAAGGLVIPADTVFLGGMQDTCTSSVTWYDVDRLPPSHRGDVDAFRVNCETAGGLDAQERCRRFDSVPLDVSPAEALRRVQERAGDLAQVRPEYGHASTAVCIVGRRERTCGLFLDRRAFLVSYDPTTDGDFAILERTLAAVGPVSSGISLCYLFSRLDPLVYGAGTKLPHNITGLIGVMDGHASDLRTGLPLQGVEIHEPVRLLMVIDATTDAIRAVLERLPAVRTLVANRWVRLAAWDPDTGSLASYEPDPAGDRFVPYVPEQAVLPVAASSADWFRGHRGHLPLARIARSPRFGRSGRREDRP